MTRPLIAGNWKMHGMAPQLVGITALAGALAAKPVPADVLICVPATLIERAVRAAGGRMGIGGQDCHFGVSGAYTGDVSAPMLKDAGAAAVIVGHSERRQHHGETNDVVAAKAGAAWRGGLLTIICIGETRAERSAGHTLSTCARQLAGSVPADLPAELGAVGYEPLWSIGTGTVPAPGEIIQVHAYIRQCLVARLGPAGAAVRILYGGSVAPENARAILALPQVGGVLVGGASLRANDFEAIARASAW
jgi:triosephosphate isomerase